MIRNSLTSLYDGMNNDKPNIIRGAMSADFDQVKAALEENPACITEADPVTGLTALHIAAGEGNGAMVDLLCSQPGYDLSIQDAWGRQPPYMAIAIGRHDIIERMMRDIDTLHRRNEGYVPDDSNVTPLRPRRPTGPA